MRAALMDVLVPSLYSGPRRPFVGARAAARARHRHARVPVQSRVRCALGTWETTCVVPREADVSMYMREYGCTHIIRHLKTIDAHRNARAEPRAEQAERKSAPHTATLDAQPVPALRLLRLRPHARSPHLAPFSKVRAAHLPEGHHTPMAARRVDALDQVKLPSSLIVG